MLGNLQARCKTFQRLIDQRDDYSHVTGPAEKSLPGKIPRKRTNGTYSGQNRHNAGANKIQTHPKRYIHGNMHSPGRERPEAVTKKDK